MNIHFPVIKIQTNSYLLLSRDIPENIECTLVIILSSCCPHFVLVILGNMLPVYANVYAK